MGALIPDPSPEKREKGAHDASMVHKLAEDERVSLLPPIPAKVGIHRPPYQVCANLRFRVGLQLSLELTVAERYV